MPITHSRRPPGRRDKRRRPEGHALPPSQTGKRAVRAVAPTAQAAVDYLRTQGKTDMADAVEVVLEYATAPTPQYGDSAMSLFVDRVFRDHVKRAAEDAQVELTVTVLEGFEKFLAGTWVPPQPERMAKGSKPDKVSMSVRAPADLVERVDARAEEFAREQGWSLARGYKLNARQVAIAYLAHTYPMPEEAPAAE